VTAHDVGARAVDFTDPPLNEVVFSVQFNGPVIDEVGILSDFWPTIRAEFPAHEKQPPLPPASEVFDGPPPPPQIQFLQTGFPQRYWFLSTDGTMIVQVQQDRLMFNWRKVTGDEEYPHYDVLAPQFEQLLQTFFDCNSVNVDTTGVGWTELQYINPIEAVEGGPTHGQLARILTFLEEDPPRTTLPDVEDTQLQERFRIMDREGNSQGRLYITAVPAFRATDQAPIYVLTLLGRGKPGPGELREGIIDFLDKAHDLIVHGFREVTTERMHRLWGARWLS
jgi:uncharacterized protein (TIGR04255 family)